MQGAVAVSQASVVALLVAGLFLVALTASSTAKTLTSADLKKAYNDGFADGMQSGNYVCDLNSLPFFFLAWDHLLPLQQNNAARLKMQRGFLSANN